MVFGLREGPGDTPERDTILADDELIAAIELPANGFAAQYAYVKVRERNSFGFASRQK
jgi:xanthine dehydrogenase YagS FAD-binding subunit